MMVVKVALTVSFIPRLETDWQESFLHGLELEPFHYFLRDHMRTLLTEDDAIGAILILVKKTMCIHDMK